MVDPDAETLLQQAAIAESLGLAPDSDAETLLLEEVASVPEAGSGGFAPDPMGVPVSFLHPAPPHHSLEHRVLEFAE